MQCAKQPVSHIEDVPIPVFAKHPLRKDEELPNSTALP